MRNTHFVDDEVEPIRKLDNVELLPLDEPPYWRESTPVPPKTRRFDELPPEEFAAWG